MTNTPRRACGTAHADHLRQLQSRDISTGFHLPLSLRGRKPVAIRSLSVPSGDGRCFTSQGMRIATAYGLAMTVIDESGYFCLGRVVVDSWSAGWCSAQRINNPMIAGGNHTLIQVPPALQKTPDADKLHRVFFVVYLLTRSRASLWGLPVCRSGCR